MEYVLRALNKTDILTNPLTNGIPSKQVLYDLTKTYLYSKDPNYFNSLTKKEQDTYIKSNIESYILSHQNSLGRKIEKRNTPIREIINHFVTYKDKESYYRLLYYLSTLNNHLVNGSKTSTSWISTTKNFDKMFKYYMSQEQHLVIAASIPTNGVYNESTLAVDVSSKEKIKELRCISTKLDIDDIEHFIQLMNELSLSDNDSNILFHNYLFNQTNPKFMGYNFSSSSEELSIYNYLNPNYILSLLEQLHIDIMRTGFFNDEYLFKNKQIQKQELERLKHTLKRLIQSTKDSYLLYVFNELYINNHNIELITSSPNEKEKMLNARRLILQNTINIPSLLIKR